MPTPADGAAPPRAVLGAGLVGPVLGAGLIGLVLLAGGCWRTGEATPGPALVTWAAFPDTVRVGEVFSFEFGGPVSATTCGRLDTAVVAVTDTSIELSARRSTFRAMCASQKIGFYEARPLVLPRAGRYAVRTAEGRRLGRLVAGDTLAFSRVWTAGDGTVREVAGCLLFGPGWIGGQRVFALSGAPAEVREVAGSDRIVHVEGRLLGFSDCGNWGSRPRIRVDTAWVTERSGDWYADGASGTGGRQGAREP